MLNIQSCKLIVLYNAWALSFTEEVESLFDFVRWWHFWLMLISPIPPNKVKLMMPS